MQEPIDAVILRTRSWPLVVLPAFVAGLLLVGLGAIPPDVRKIDTTHYLLFVGGLTAAVASLCYLAWRQFGAEAVQADAGGLAIASRRHGSRHLHWSDVDELGWVPSVGARQGGMAARILVPASQSHSASDVRWLCQPSGWISRGRIRRLQLLTEQAGVRWRTYRHADLA